MIGGAGLAAYGAALVLLVVTGRTGVRYTADSADTLPLWAPWIGPVVGILLIRLLPLRPSAGPRPQPSVSSRRLAFVYVLLAVAFAVVLTVLGAGEPTYTISKLTLLVIIPLGLTRVPAFRAAELIMVPERDLDRRWRHWGAAVVVLGWGAATFLNPWRPPRSTSLDGFDVGTLMITVLFVFLINAGVEELFYRRWLQTNLEASLGPWPAIIVASLCWAIWHISTQGSGDLLGDLASAVINQGVTGLFLGYLWSRYRLMWPLLVAHGAINALPVLI